MKLRVIPAALVAVSALALSLLSPVSATAQSPEYVPVHVSSLKLYRDAASQHRVNYSANVSTKLAIDVTNYSGSAFRINKITADLYVAGRKRTTINLPTSSTTTWQDWSRNFGPGATQLRNLKVTGYYTHTPSATRVYNLSTVSNTVRVKRAREHSSFFVSKYGKKMNFSVYGYRAYKKNGKLAPARKANLQRRVGKKWKQVKRFAIKRNGTTKFTISNSKKYKYRIIIKGTKFIEGANAVTEKKI